LMRWAAAAQPAFTGDSTMMTAIAHLKCWIFFRTSL